MVGYGLYETQTKDYWGRLVRNRVGRDSKPRLVKTLWLLLQHSLRQILRPLAVGALKKQLNNAQIVFA